MAILRAADLLITNVSLKTLMEQAKSFVASQLQWLVFGIKAGNY